jgi:hypothetical protein
LETIRSWRADALSHLSMMDLHAPGSSFGAGWNDQDCEIMAIVNAVSRIVVHCAGDGALSPNLVFRR